MTLLHRLGINGGVCGHVFCRIVPARPPKRLFPRVIVLDPATVTPEWLPDDFETVTKFTIAWNAIDPVSGKPMAMRQIISCENLGQPTEQWRIVDQYSPGDRVTWITTNDEIWPWSFCPIFHCQNLPAPNEMWGVSDLEDDVLSAQKALNFAMTNMNRILRNHAHPKTWGKGFDAKQLSIAVDETICLPVNGELHNLEMQSDLSSSITFTERIKRALHEIARVPEIATGGIENLGQISGVALAILYQSLIEKTNTKRRLYGDMLVELCEAALTMAGKPVQEAVLHWPEMLPADKLAQAQTAVLYDQLGVSRDTILSQLGFDSDQEASKKADEQKDLGENILTQFDRGQMNNAQPDANEDNSSQSGVGAPRATDRIGYQDGN